MDNSSDNNVSTETVDERFHTFQVDALRVC